MKKIKKIILEFPKTFDLFEEDRILTEVDLTPPKGKEGLIGKKMIVDFKFIIEIDFLEYLKDVMRKFEGKITFEE